MKRVCKHSDLKILRDRSSVTGHSPDCNISKITSTSLMVCKDWKYQFKLLSDLYMYINSVCTGHMEISKMK